MVVVAVEGGGDGDSGGAKAFDGGDSGFDDVADVPKLGSFVHVVVKPLVTDREVKFLDKKCEMRVRGS